MICIICCSTSCARSPNRLLDLRESHTLSPMTDEPSDTQTLWSRSMTQYRSMYRPAKSWTSSSLRAVSYIFTYSMIFCSSLQDFGGFSDFGLENLSLLQAFRQLTLLNWRDLLVFGYQNNVMRWRSLTNCLVFTLPGTGIIVFSYLHSRSWVYINSMESQFIDLILYWEKHHTCKGQ